MDETPLLFDETPFYKVASTKLPAYIYDIIQTHSTLSLAELSILETHFFPCVIGEWNKLNSEIRRSGSCNIFRKSILNFIRPSASRVYNINDVVGIKFMTRLRLGFSHLREHKFKHNF